MPPRRPIRPLDKSKKAEAYPKELLVDYTTGDISVVDDSGVEHSSTTLTPVSEGTGNGVAEVIISGRKVTIRKQNFLTEHPAITTTKDTTSAETPGSGGTFTTIDSVTRDANGHVTKVNTKTVTMPTVPDITNLEQDVTNAASAAQAAQNTANSAAGTANNAVNIANSKASTVLYKATIGTGWAGGAAPFTQNVGVGGMTVNDTPIVDVDLSSVAYGNKDGVIEAYSKIYRVTTYNGGITVYADEKTTVNVPIQLKVIR